MSDFAQLLGNTSSSGILILLLFPVTGLILVTGYIVFFFARRSKQAKMSQSEDADIALLQPADGLDTTVLTGVSSSFDPSDNRFRAADNLDLNLNLLQNGIEMEYPPMNNSLHFSQKKAASSKQLENQVGAVPDHPAEPEELLRLLRDPQSGQMLVQVSGQRYQKLADITDKGVGQFILKVAAHLLAFTNGMIVTDSGVMSLHNPKVGQTPKPVAAPIRIASASSNSSGAAASIRPAADLSVPKPSSEAALLNSLAVPPPQSESTLQPLSLFGRVKPTPPPAALPALNLAQEINEIVQTRLKYMPLGQTSKVEVLSGPDGGIKINVNGRFYSSPDEVPDLEVKALIKESIKQWETS